MKVIKRDGRKVEYNSEKPINAMLAAFTDVYGEITEEMKDFVISVSNSIEKKDKSMNVEDIQDIIESKLMSSKYKDVAKAYIKYRYDRTRIRNNNSSLMRQISEKITASNVQNQNANIDESSFGGRIGEASDAVLKEYALNNCMSDMARENHLNNMIYIHDLNSYAVGMHNCCSRDTKFLTDHGVFSFEDFNDGDVIFVLTHTGEFKKATVHNYGKQHLNKITFSRPGQKFVTEKFTKDHRWILKDGSVTTSLSIGDKLVRPPMIRDFDFYSSSDSEKYYWCLGFVLADGTEAYRWSHGVKNENIKFVRLRLCGEKTQYEDRFSLLKHSTKILDNGDLYLTFSSLIDFRKSFPNIEEMSWKEKLALFDGVYAADGLHATTLKSIMTTDEQMASFIEDVAPSLGYYIIYENETTGEITNFAKRGFSKEYRFISDSNKYYWTVVDIENDSEEDVWCLDVEDDHSFVLPNGIVTGNCMSIPFDDLLSKGFNTRQTDVRPANSINTAFQLVAVIFQLQSLQEFGGVSATHLDWTMVPYVRKSFIKHYIDGLTYLEWDSKKYTNHCAEEFLLIVNEDMTIDNDYFKEINNVYNYALDMTTKELMQAVEGMYHNLNTLQSRSGNQLPFTSINYGTCTLPEGRMVIKALLEGSIKGVGKFHKTSIFPCGIFQCMNGVNRKPGDPNYDLFQLALKSTSQRLYPNYANVDWTGNAGYDINDPRTYFSTMGCRTANGWDINGFGQLKDGRGNICPVTLILPTLAMESGRDVEKFMLLLDAKLHEAKDMLLERFNWIASQSPDSAKFMYENNVMAGYIPEEGIVSALKHGTLAVGQVGLAETLQLLIGKNHTTDEGMELAKRIEGLFKQRCSEFKEEYKLNFGVYYTPAENLVYTAMNKFKEKYGIIENVSDKDFFTNSIHVPVWIKMNPFEKIDIESQLTGYSSAGCICYTELESTARYNLEALEEIVNYAMDHDIPYFALNVPNDMCTKCGYTDEIGDECPVCGCRDIRRLRRVTGYLTGDYKTSFNKGKQQEVEMRVKHTKSLSNDDWNRD